ncbi:AlbA family DNA-binding domain-containing protein [Jannaschia pohangensis]|uniref:Putative DNA-binding domain-containing protein n=1 Tax=Jannaschia pohangensis TaxID=390807 RepID=A0A1I3JD09_9RHOB|nr:ATP-binding protein [Jannaschia pohangensis]SFI58151.1 Putative DNA-binding domain-containing protein [Jannaschia pohangensis]
MTDYTPFKNTKLSNLTALDLNDLSQVREGWYVEYKEKIPNSKSIAKSVSSFANTYGGWIFYGIKERSGADNSAECCPGINHEQLDESIQTIRQSISAHLNPLPHFEIKILTGPNSEMGLSEICSVICIHVPMSFSTPHIHSNGCIFRRVADSSEPKSETDRHQLDNLWERGEKVNQKYEDWVKRHPELTEGDVEIPYLRILLDADLRSVEGASWRFSSKEISTILNEPDSGPYAPVDSCYRSNRGLIARQTSSLSKHSQFGLTWIIGPGLKSEIWIPLNLYYTHGDLPYIVGFEKYENTTEFYELLRSSRVTDGKILDLNQIWQTLISIMNRYIQLLEKNNTPKNKIFAKTVISGVRQCIPFLDSSTILCNIKTQGLPFCIYDEVITPFGYHPDTFHEIINIFDDEGFEKYLFPTLMVMELVCAGLGVPGFFEEPGSQDLATLLRELSEAGERAVGRKAAQNKELGS